VEWIGEADGPTKKELLAKARCLLLPIRWEEPFGLVMVEAMACGTPVIALRRGSVPEVVADGVTGIICDDPAELPRAIGRAGELSPASCRRRARQRFDVAVLAASYEGVYRGAAGPGPQSVRAASGAGAGPGRGRRPVKACLADGSPGELLAHLLQRAAQQPRDVHLGVPELCPDLRLLEVPEEAHDHRLALQLAQSVEQRGEGQPVVRVDLVGRSP
jgi:hypothetical protein